MSELGGTIESKVYAEDSSVGDMDSGLGSQLVKRWKKLNASSFNWFDQWQQIAQYIMPHRSNITVKRSRGEKQTDKLFDSTAIHANNILAASMQGTITNPAIKWFQLKLRNDEFNRNTEIAEWLESATEKMHLALRQSNFYSEIHEAYLDLGAFGTAALYCEEDNNDLPGFRGLLFRAIPIGDYVIAEDPDGRVDTLFRTFNLSVRTVVQKWGLDSVSDKVKDKFKTDQDEEIAILHAVYPRMRTRKMPAPLTPKTRLPWASVYVELTSKNELNQGGYEEFSYMVPRWSKTSGEIYGRGPGFTVMPDVKTLNKLVELSLKALAKHVDPPLMLLDDGVIGNVKLTPGGGTTVRSDKAITPIPLGGRFDVKVAEQDRLIKSIQQIYYVEQLLHLMSRERPAITATEAQIKLQTIQGILGPVFGRLDSELLNPAIDRVFGIMLRAGVFNPVPAPLRALGAKLDVQFEGPLAKAQRNQEFFGTQRVLEVAGALAQIDQSVVDRINPDFILTSTGDIAGAPLRIFRSDEEVEAIRQARAQAQNEAAAATQAEQMAKAAGAIAPTLKVLQEGAAGGL